MIGRTIAHYRIQQKLGEGGMGAVYQAEDLRLGRTVALKFISTKVAGSPQARARFMREAHASALVDHPNVCSVHGFDEREGLLFIVMAFVDGASLSQRMRTSPPSPAEAVDYSIQMAEGLKAAHDKGIVHRDLKPANIMITPAGQVKIMDFGLAFLADRPRLTTPGTVVGTFAYMSPEQVQGKPVDGRSDFWALGALLCEMVTQRAPFEDANGKTDLRAIVEAKPRLEGLRAVSPNLERIVATLLQKEPAWRYQSAGHLIADLRAIREKLPDKRPAPSCSPEEASTVTVGAPAVYPRARGMKTLIAAAASLLLAIAALAAWALLR